LNPFCGFLLSKRQRPFKLDLYKSPEKRNEVFERGKAGTAATEISGEQANEFNRTFGTEWNDWPLWEEQPWEDAIGRKRRSLFVLFSYASTCCLKYNLWDRCPGPFPIPRLAKRTGLPLLRSLLWFWSRVSNQRGAITAIDLTKIATFILK